MRNSKRTSGLRRRAATACALAGLSLTGLAGCSGGSGGENPGGTATAMQVTPQVGFTASGPVGGPFATASQDYTVTNLGTDPLDYLVRANESWIQLSSTGGQIAVGDSVTVQVAIDQAAAALLGPGSYAAIVDFLNVTPGSEGAGDVSVQVDLDVLGPASLTVAPADPYVVTGPEGVGPFLPLSKDYVLTNNGPLPLDWSAQASRPEFLLSAAGGQLAPSGQPGSQATVTVTLDQAAAIALSLGTYTASIDFTNLTSGVGTTVRSGTLNVTPRGATASSLSQFGITWTFDTDYTVGQFANGDWWVLGPVTIVDINPPSTAPHGGRTVNGSMVNPTPRNGQTQGYDSAMYDQYKSQLSKPFDPALNVAMGVSPATPLVLGPHSSLVSSISLPTAGARPQLRTAAVLTVLDAVPPAGSFRPPYVGDDKTIRYNKAQLQTALLAKLTPVASTPTLGSVERMFERPWIDHVPDWLGRYTHPQENMPDYGREICDEVGFASLMLHLNFTEAQKETLLVRFVQLGIDFYWIVENGGQNNWPAGGGHHSGRKWPILFAGLMLGDAAMTGIGSHSSVAFNEDDQTFYVQETSPGVYNYGEGSYGPQHVGMPEWGNQHWKQINRGQTPTFDNVDWQADPYRLCCTANVWWGQLLAAHIMGVKPLWKHDALFDYQDRYYTENVARGLQNWLTWSAFSLDMWQAYRSHY